MTHEDVPQKTSETAKPTVYLTTAIPYVNAPPHIGFALEAIQTDVLARHHRAKGRAVRFQTGTDENSLKNVQAAEQAGLETADLVARNARAFHGLRAALDLSFDDFIRTSAEARHRRGVERLWRACAERGDIYRRRYRGLYCVGCEQFYKSSELAGGLCPEHGTAPEEVAEENYFFRLSRYEGALRQHIRNGDLRIEPESRRNEVLRWIDEGLEDISISRSSQRARGWGLPVPDDPSQVVYVWFDALGNYVTALDYAGEGSAFQQFWLSAQERIHVIGKGITRFHALYWPAILLSADQPLPTRVLVHGYVTVEGEKIGKSRGNAIDPVPLSEALGADALRYYLLRHVRTTEDGDFSRERFVQAYESELANQLGNLAQRILGMIARYFDGVIPEPSARAIGSDLDRAVQALPETVDALVERFALHEALAAIWAVIGEANGHIADRAPWSLAKQISASSGPTESQAAEAQLRACLYDIAQSLRVVARCAWPFLPSTCDRLAVQLGLASALSDGCLAGRRISKAEILFPKADVQV